MYRRLALGLTVVIVAASCQTGGTVEEATGDRVVDRSPGEPTGRPAGTSITEPSYAVRRVPQPGGPSVPLSMSVTAAPGRNIIRLPLGDFSLQLTQPWAADRALRSGSSQMVETLRGSDLGLSLQYPLSRSTTVGLGLRSLFDPANDVRAGGMVSLGVRRDMGGLSVGAGVQAYGELGASGRARSRFGSAFTVEF